MQPQNIFQAEAGMKAFLAAQRLGAKVFYEPFYSRVDLAGLAVVDAGTLTLGPQEIQFFSGSVGAQNAGGFGRPLTFADTNLVGGSNALPGGVSYVIDKCGVYMDPLLPRVIKSDVAEFSALSQTRLSHTWRMGKTGFWPAAGYGVQALSTTVNATDYSVNGRIALVELPKKAWMYFPAKQVVDFKVTTYRRIFVTDDGTETGADLEVDDFAFLAVLLYGWRIEVNSVG